MTSQVNNEIRRSVKRISSSIEEPQTLADLFLYDFEKRPRDELTPTLKIKRHVIDEKYSSVIEKIYLDNDKNK